MLYVSVQAFISGNVLVAVYLLHIHLGLMTLQAYIITWLFVKGTEAEVASL